MKLGDLGGAGLKTMGPLILLALSVANTALLVLRLGDLNVDKQKWASGSGIKVPLLKPAIPE